MDMAIIETIQAVATRSTATIPLCKHGFSTACVIGKKRCTSMDSALISPQHLRADSMAIPLPHRRLSKKFHPFPMSNSSQRPGMQGGYIKWDFSHNLAPGQIGMDDIATQSGASSRGRTATPGLLPTLYVGASRFLDPQKRPYPVSISSRH